MMTFEQSRLSLKSVFILLGAETTHELNDWGVSITGNPAKSIEDGVSCLLSQSPTGLILLLASTQVFLSLSTQLT